MLNRFVLTSLLVLLVGCGESGDTTATGGRDPEAERIAQENRTRQICVSAAMATISGEPRDNSSVLSRMNKANITACPGDFASLFVGLRQKFEEAVEFDAQLAAHQREGEGAVVGGLAVSFAEWLLEADSGITPFSDWVEQDSSLRDRATTVARELRASFQALERDAARYGVDLSAGSADPQNTQNRTLQIILVKGDDLDGKKIYAFVGMTGPKLTEFMSAQRSGQVVYPENYGKVILSGEGEPTEEVYRRMETEYGFDRNAMSDIH